MSNYDNGIVIGFIGGKDYVSQDNGDGTHSLICPIGKVPEIKRNHDRLVEENAGLREMLSRDKTAFLNQIELDLIKDSAKQETRELAESIHKLLSK